MFHYSKNFGGFSTCIFFHFSSQSHRVYSNSFVKYFTLPSHQVDIFTKIYKTNEHPQVASTLYNIAQQRSNIGDYQRAIEEFEKVLGNQKTN
jgi:tetratricopeptide (TPR) repeat protein